MDPSTSDSRPFPRIQWPDGKSFAFTVFDDPDFQSLDRGVPVYEFLSDLGFRTTKGVWPGDEACPPSDRWGTCMDPEYLKWALSLKDRGFEIGWHGASPRTSSREKTAAGFESFRRMFGHWPATMSQHYNCKENMYWGDDRLTSAPLRFAYNLLTRWKNHDVFHGHVPGHPNYWGDLSKKYVKYARNFVFAEINTLAACPQMPYHDPARPQVNYWYAAAEGHNVETFTRMLCEENQDKLEAEGGACIMYAHFAYGFATNGVVDARFRSLMERLRRRNGWFVPTATLLDYIAEQRGAVTLDARQRNALERRWLMHKVRFGTA
jgi:hypothetical protein